MPDERPTKLTREQLYNEIWEISVTGVAKKYNIPYAFLLKRCKEFNIPYPTSGYWTQLSYGKPVTQIPLPKSELTEVDLSDYATRKNIKRNSPTTKSKTILSNISNENDLDSVLKNNNQSDILENQAEFKGQDDFHNKPSIYREVINGRNIYNREKLYKEVWERPVVEVAAQYGVSDVAIHKVCKSMNIPVPPRGYWAKLRAGEKMEQPPLPNTNGVTEKIGSKTFEGVKESFLQQRVLEFLTDSEREIVLLAAQQIELLPENSQLHKKINAYKSVVKEWNKKDTKPEGAQRSFKNYSNRPPFLAGVISDATLPRVYRILDALFRNVERLGGTINDDLSLQIRNEHVRIEIFEAQDEIKHVITKQEARELLIYEDAKRHHTWASEPKIRKYDYVFNGRLRICIRQGRYFRDSDKINVEMKLGDMLIELYEESQIVRINREAREEAQRKREEEERLREERRIRYNSEVERTNALTNMSQDYDIACKIRAYISALEAKENIDEKTKVFIDWAKKKADWYDPTIAFNDELLGKRDHSKDADLKVLKRSGYYW